MTEQAALKKLRPWYFVAAMCLAWISGALTVNSGYIVFGHLRGDQQFMDHLRESEASVEQSTLPLSMKQGTHVGRMYQEARLVALGDHHRSAFPLSVAQMLLGVVLALLSFAALGGYKNTRTPAMQAAAASLLLAVVAFALETPIRDAATLVMEQRALAELGVYENLNEEQTQMLYASMGGLREWFGLLLFGIGVPLFALFALSRPKTRAFFDAVAEAAPTSERL